MNFKIMTTIALASLSFSSFAISKMTCQFTEPFYDIELDLDNGTVKEMHPNWDDLGDNSDLPIVTTDKSSNLRVIRTQKNGALTYDIVRNKDQSTYLTLTMDFEGSNGMSDHVMPFSAVNHRSDVHKYYGGCVTEDMPQKDEYEVSLDANKEQFFKSIKAASKMCFNRAVSTWTSAKSKYKNETVFSVLYATEDVPGEPGGVSSTFASGEGEQLDALLVPTKTVPNTKGEFATFKDSTIKFCEFYTSRLLDRI